MNLKVLAIALPALALAWPVASTAHEPESSAREILALGRVHSYGWLTVAGPDSAGRYGVTIAIDDLNVSTPEGWSAMAARVKKGTGDLCDLTDRPQFAGFYDANQRECWRDSMARAHDQMEHAREIAAHGGGVSSLGFDRPLSR